MVRSRHHHPGIACKWAVARHVRMLRVDTKAAAVAHDAEASGNAAAVQGAGTGVPPHSGQRLPLQLAAVGSLRWRGSILVRIGDLSQPGEVQTTWT